VSWKPTALAALVVIGAGLGAGAAIGGKTETKIRTVEVAARAGNTPTEGAKPTPDASPSGPTAAGTTATTTGAPQTTPPTLFAGQPLVLRDTACDGGDTYVTLDDPPSVTKSSSTDDVFEYGGCGEDKPTISIGSEIEASPLPDPDGGRDACLSALRSDEAASSIIASEGIAVCFRTPSDTIAKVVVDKVDRDGTAHVSATGWSDK